MTFDEIISRFEVKEKYRDSVKCICPAHADKEASLSISRGEKGTVLHCHADCKTADILEKVGLQMKDLFDDSPIQTGERWRSYIEGREKRPIEAVYHYTDLSGQYAFTRVRLSGKKFIYGIMDGDRFNYGLKGKSRKSIPAVYCNGLKSLQDAISEGRRVFYTEGEKDVNTVNSHGLTGVTCGASGDWVPGCATLFSGADVVVLADNDAPGLKLARQVEKDVSKVAKSVKVIVPTPEIEHGDISDFFKDHTVEDLEALLTKPEPEPEAEPMNLDQFHLISENGRITGVYDFGIFQHIKERESLFVLGGTVYIYRDGIYHPDYSGAVLKTMIRDCIYPEYIKSHTIKRIHDLFLSDASLQRKAEDLNQYPDGWVPFENGFRNAVDKRMEPHNPRYLCTNVIPHVYNPDADLQRETVEEWFQFLFDDPDDREMFLEYSGLSMTKDTRQQKALFLVGEGNSGKSTVIKLEEKAIGSDNVSNISLNQLSQRFFSFGLMGKFLNTVADLEIGCLEDASKFKQVLGEDTILAEQKGRDAISFRNYAKFIFSCNELPIVKAERTNGFYRRLLILTMNKVPEKIETDFFDRLAKETDYFIRLCVEALERMYERGRIIESKGSIEAVRRLRCESDTVEAFLTEFTGKKPDERIKKLNLYRDYEAYCLDMGRQSLTKQNFYRSMKSKGYAEIKTNGVEYFKGIFYLENLPENLPKSPLNGFFPIDDADNPFAK